MEWMNIHGNTESKWNSIPSYNLRQFKVDTKDILLKTLALWHDFDSF